MLFNRRWRVVFADSTDTGELFNQRVVEGQAAAWYTLGNETREVKPMEQNNTLGKRIAMLRKNQGWTQEQLGEKVGVSAQAVSKWENDLACPDISVLPLLADLFGITTDELLGIKPIDPHVVILDKEPEQKEKDDKGFNMKWEASPWSRISLCIMAILICVVLILRSTTPLFNREGVNVWNYIWPIAVFSLGLMRVKNNVVFGITAMVVGVYELIWFGWGVPFEIKWYVILLVLAVSYLIRNLLEACGVRFPNKKWDGVVTVNGKNPSRIVEYSDEGYYLKAELSFGSNQITYPYDTLKGMELETNFGDHRVDLRNVKEFQNDPVLDVEVNFGNVIICLPENVRLHKNSDTAFAAMRIKGEPAPNADQVAYLRGEVNFGNLEIQYPNA